MHHAEEPVESLPFIVRAEHQEPDHPIARRHHHYRVDPRYVIDHQQRAFPGHVVLVGRADAVNGVGHQPQHQPHQEVGQHRDDVSGAGQGQNRHRQDRLPAAHPQDSGEQPRQHRARQHGGESQDIGKRDEPSFHPGRSPLLEHRVERDDEQARGQPEHRQIRGGAGRDQRNRQQPAVPRPAQQQGEDADADAAQWHQADFEMLAGKPARQHRANPDAYRQQRQQHPGALLAQPQRVVAEHRNDGEKERPEHPEPGDADYRV